MATPALTLRRATVDDLPALKALWQLGNLPAAELETRLTEFQVVESSGEFAGALGLQVVRQHALLHSEEYQDFSVADAARELFWERTQKIASNLGVFRLWTQQTSPFWTGWGFHPADAGALAKLPAQWKPLAGQGRWLTLELKNEEAINQVLETQFAGFMDSEKRQTERVANQARILRLIITIAGFLIFAVCVVLAVFLLMRRQRMH